MPTTAYSRRIFQLFALLLLLAFSVPSALADEGTARQPFSIDDYFEIRRITELRLSSDGKMIAYAVESQSLEENKTLRHIYISPTTPGAEPELIEDIQDARSIAWIANRHELAFLVSDDGSTQVFSYDLASKTISQHTQGEFPVTKFHFAPDGQSLAYLTHDTSNGKPSLYEQFQTGEKGILIDSDNISIYDFIDPNWPDLTVKPLKTLWLALAGKEPFRAEILGNAIDFYWSPDAKKLSVTFVANDIPSSLGSDRRTSLGIYDTNNKRLRLLATATPPSKGQAGKSYAGGEWFPNVNNMIIRRITEADSGANADYPEWTLVDMSAIKMLEDREQTWNEIEYYGLDAKPAFLPLDDTTIYTNKTVMAVRSLYRLTASGALELADIVRDVKGSARLFQFSANFEQAVFIVESLTHPPEIYIWRKGQDAQKLTSINEELAQRIMPTAKELIWKSKDGVAVHGWLLGPAGAEQDNKPLPLITFVHGGPTLAMPNEFLFYFPYWPYPFEVYALNGMVVFIPNYRGTKTYGRKFTEVSRIDGEPVDDIISGIDHLIQLGIANPKRLAISGHSYGALLAPLVMAREKIFRAGSFAEGAGNFIVNYDLMTGRLNRNVHDAIIGNSLYDNPERYIELSPELHFKGLQTAVLFEAGARTSAINMLGYPKAARNAGMPAEYIIYPQTGHNQTMPRLQKESVERNLDWFRFWLKGEKDPDPAKAEQYQRWHKMRQH